MMVYCMSMVSIFGGSNERQILNLYFFDSGIKKGELQLSFKSLPGPRINKVVLGGPTRDRIFIAQDSTVKGYTKKGKLFLEFDTNLIDPITSL